MQAPAPSGQPELQLTDLSEINFAMTHSRTLTTAVQLGLFSQIAAGRRTASEIASGAGSSERGTRMLLDALVALRLLAKKDGQYTLAPVAARYLVR
ncbi:MAG: methyltransferase family protein [Terriglobia bacterium]